jgi:hypothetical protein
MQANENKRSMAILIDTELRAAALHFVAAPVRRPLVETPASSLQRPESTRQCQPSRIVRNSFKTKDGCTFYSTLRRRGLPALFGSQGPSFYPSIVSSRIGRNSLETNDRNKVYPSKLRGSLQALFVIFVAPPRTWSGSQATGQKSPITTHSTFPASLPRMKGLRHQ